jgi:4-hydroxy-3-polyprenylbenzoate decarboxylase
MPYRDLRAFIERLEREGELRRIKAEVDWNLELSHIAKINEERGGPALLFENVKGYKSPVFASAFASTSRLALAMDMPKASHLVDLMREWVKRTASKVPA